MGYMRFILSFVIFQEICCICYEYLSWLGFQDAKFSKWSV